jgi:hypothetical protein
MYYENVFMIEYFKVRNDYRFQSVFHDLQNNPHYKQIKNNPHYPSIKMILDTDPCWILFCLLSDLHPNAIVVAEDERGVYNIIRQKWIDWFNKEEWAKLCDCTEFCSRAGKQVDKDGRVVSQYFSPYLPKFVEGHDKECRLLIMPGCGIKVKIEGLKDKNA